METRACTGSIRSCFSSPLNCTNIYDTSLLESTFRKYIDVKKLNQPDRTRLIVTAVNVRSGEQAKFDNLNMDAQLQAHNGKRQLSGFAFR